MLLHDRRLRDLIFEMSRRAACKRIKLLIAVSVDRLGLRALQLLLLLLLRAQARHAYHLVTFFVNGQLADGAFEPLPSEAPNPILAERAEGLLQNSKTEALYRRYIRATHPSPWRNPHVERAEKSIERERDMILRKYGTCETSRDVCIEK